MLPMMEARISGTPVIASDYVFSHSILDEYENTSFFHEKDCAYSANLMKAAINYQRRIE